MKLNEAIILEAKFAQPIIAYHGTDINNLRSILSQGLTRNKVGTGWGGWGEGSAHRRDMSAIGGVYFATNLSNAITASPSSEKLIVVAQVQPRSSYVDEDMIDLEIRNAISATHNKNIMRERLALYTALKWLSYQGDAIDVFLSNLPDFYRELIERQPLHRSLVRNVIVSYIQRSLAYEVHSDSWAIASDGIERMTGMNRADAQEVAREAMRRMPSPQEAEREYRAILERLTIVMKRSIYDPDRGSVRLRSTTFRIEEDIGYRGSNRIIAVMSLGSDYRPTVHYGELPYQTIKALEELR